VSPARPSRVIVIGAGAAGLAAAARLCRSVDVVVVEARDRLGGRIDTRLDPVLGISVEHGAEFLHGRPPRNVALARRAGARVRVVPERHARRAARRVESATATFSRA
jgi:protoporphyrinogen oxidase